MKTKSYLIGLLLTAGLFTGYLFVPAATSNPQQACEVVSFAISENSGFGADGTPAGLTLRWVNRTPGAPEIVPGMRFVDAVAILRNARYQKDPDSVFGYSTYIR